MLPPVVPASVESAGTPSAEGWGGWRRNGEPGAPVCPTDAHKPGRRDVIQPASYRRVRRGTRCIQPVLHAKKLAQRIHHAVCSTLRTVGIGLVSNISMQGTNVWTSNECGPHWLDCWNVSPNARVVALSMLAMF